MSQSGLTRLVIHAGLPKAASTSLQKRIFPQFVNGQVSFRGKVSGPGWSEPGQWRALNDYCIRRIDSAKPAAINEMALADGGAIFSSEDFISPFGFRAGSLAPCIVPSFDRLDRLLSIVPQSTQVMMLMVIRRQIDWLPSFHFESVKQGYFADPDIDAFWRFLSEETGWARDCLDYAAFIERLGKRHPHLAIEVLPMERLVDDPYRALRPVADFLDLPAQSAAKASPTENSRKIRGGRTRVGRADRRFMRRRLLLQLVDPAMPLAARIARLRLLGSLIAGPLRFGGLSPRLKDARSLRSLAASNAKLLSARPDLSDIGAYGYFEQPA